MRWQEIKEYKTKSGSDIIIKYHEDIEGDRNRGWILHKLDAHVDGALAGYLKISYIPKERFKKYYPTVLNYMSQIGGSSGFFPIDKRHIHYKDLNDDELTSLLSSLSYNISKYHHIWNSSGKEGVPDSREEKINIIEDIIKNHLKNKIQEFKEFKNYFVDKPLVDYISVSRGDIRNDNLLNQPIDFQRQGIGTALYLEGAKWLKKKNMVLHGSGNASKSATAAWDNLEKMGYVKYTKPAKGRMYGHSGRRYVDPNKI